MYDSPASGASESVLFPESRYRLEDFIEATGGITSRESLYDYFRETMLSCGFDRVNFSIKRDDEVPEDDHRFGIISNYPEDWQKHYADAGYVRIDPVFRCAISTFHPFRWKDLERVLDLSPAQTRFLRLGEEAGLNNGIGIPFAGPRTQIAGVALATSDRKGEHLTNMDLISAYCNQFYATYKRIIRARRPGPPKMISLSPREQEVLKWVAAGKSDDAIANILNVSSNTVAYHLRNVFIKLEVNNRVTAVVVAMTQGLLEI